jgi:hypothetical protein
MNVGPEASLISPGAAIYGVANASSSNNSSVEVWIKGVLGGTAIYAERLAHGQNLKVSPIGKPIPITYGLLSEPSAAMDSHGNIVVTWSQTINGSSAVRGCMITAKGKPGAPFTVAMADLFSSVSDSHVAANAAGGFVVTYTHQSVLPNPHFDVEAALYNNAGKLVKPPIDVATGLKSEPHSSVAMTASGSFDVAYERNVGKGKDIYLARYSSLGKFIWNKPIANSSNDESEPCVSVDDSGAAVVVYTISEDMINANRVTSGGTVQKTIPLGSYTVEIDPAVSVLRKGGKFAVAFVIAPSQSGDFYLPNIVFSTVDAKNNLSTVALAGNKGQLLIDPGLSVDGSNHVLLSFQTYGSAHGTPYAQFGTVP